MRDMVLLVNFAAMLLAWALVGTFSCEVRQLEKVNSQLQNQIGWADAALKVKNAEAKRLQRESDLQSQQIAEADTLNTQLINQHSREIAAIYRLPIPVKCDTAFAFAVSDIARRVVAAGLD